MDWITRLVCFSLQFQVHHDQYFPRLWKSHDKSTSDTHLDRIKTPNVFRTRFPSIWTGRYAEHVCRAIRMTTFNECSLPPTSVFGIQNHTNRSKRKKKSTAFDFVKCCINLFQQSEKWILRFPRLESWIGFTRVGPTSMHVCKVKNENIQVRICPHPNLECCMFVKRHRSASNGQVDVEIVQHAINFCPILLLLDAMHLIY